MDSRIKLKVKGVDLLNRIYYFQNFEQEKIQYWNLRRGEIITIEDSGGNHYRSRIVESESGEIGIYTFEACSLPMISKIDILLLQAMPARERMEWIIQKSVELGIKTILPFKSIHSISLSELKQLKAHRWAEVALKAAKQCRRADIPQIVSYRDFNRAIDYAKDYEIKIILSLETSNTLDTILSKLKAACKIAILVGPEGGWDNQEILEAKEAGFYPINLGPRILRTETAAICSVALIQYLSGDMGTKMK